MSKEQLYPGDRFRMAAEMLIPVVERTTETLLTITNAGWGDANKEQRPLYVQAGSEVTDRSVGAAELGEFLCAIFDEWVADDVGEVFVQHFDTALANWHGVPGAVCVFSDTCGLAVALDLSWSRRPAR